MNIPKEWNNLLIDVVIARNYYWIGHNNHGMRIAELDSAIVSGLLIRSVSFLDKVLVEYIKNQNITIENPNPKLFHRLQELNNQSLLKDYDDIDKWRDRRNDVGHEISETFTWDELDLCLEAIFRELSNLNMLDRFPKFDVKQTTSAMEADEGTGKFKRQMIVSVHENDNPVYEFGWDIKIG